MTQVIDQFFAHVERFSQSDKLNDEQLAMNFRLGLVGEAGEICDLIKKALYHGQAVTKDQYLSELGDWLWYAIALMRLEKGDLEAIRPVLEGQAIALMPLGKTALNLAEESACYANGYAYASLEQAVNQWGRVCDDLDIHPTEVMQFNQTKLEKRHNGQRFNAEAALASKAAE